MNFLEIFNFLNPTGLGNILFYPLFTIFASYCVGLSLWFWDPKNRNIHILISIPKIITIICICVNGLWRLKEVIDSLFVFQMFVLLIGMLMLGGIITEFKLKYMLATNSISMLLHGSFYFYCKHYDAGVISEAFHPTFEYLVFLVLTNFFICHLTLPDHIKIVNVNTPFLNWLMPVNEKNSHRTIILFQAYSMIIHSTFMVFIYNSTLPDYWMLIFVCFAVFLQLIFVILCLRIMHQYPSSANAPFYISAYLMIIKTLMDLVSTNIHSYICNKPFNVQSRYFSNKLMYLFVYILVICILSGEVAIAADEPSSPVSESNIFNRISQSSASKLLMYASFYEGVSAFREWVQEQIGLGSEKEELLTAVENCHNAKADLEKIPYKKPCEVLVINEAKYVLKGSEINSANLSSEELTKYTERLEEVTRKMNAHIDTYNAYKNHNTDYLLRRLFGVTNCCCGSRDKA